MTSDLNRNNSTDNSIADIMAGGKISQVPRTQLVEMLRMQRDLAAWLSVCPNLETAVTDVLDQVVWLDGIDYAALHMANEDGSLDRIAQTPKDILDLSHMYHADNDSPLAVMARESDTRFLNREEIVTSAEMFELPDEISAIAILSLKYGGETEAVLCAASLTVDAIPIIVQDILESIAGLTAAAIARFRAESARQESERRFEEMALASSDWIWEIDKDKRFTFVTAKIEEVLGYKPFELIGKSLYDLLPSDQTAKYTQIYDTVMSMPPREIRNLETWTTRRDGVPICIATNGKPILSETGELIGYRGVDKDITKRKLAEEALKKAKEEAELANAAKSEFLANMSHEIRTPMNGVIGMLDLLARTHLSEKQAQYITLARQSGEHLLSIINDILDFSKLRALKAELKKVDFNLHQLVDDTLAIFVERGRKRGLDVNPDIRSNVPLVVCGDERRIRQVLINLLGNALKFTETGSITLRVSREKRISLPDTVFIRFDIIDTGPGIAEDVQQRLFDPFCQADTSYTRKHVGTGLGLAIVKELVELMEGRLTVDSEVGEGATFTFSIPLIVRPEETLVTKSSISFKRLSSQKGIVGRIRENAPHILIAEDNEINQVVTTNLLKELGCTTEIVWDGTQAIEAVQNKSFDLILMDCQMPKLDGYQATREIRKLENGARVPIIALTAHATVEDRERAIKAGMDDYLSKPITSKQLSGMLETFLQLSDDVLSIPPDLPFPGEASLSTMAEEALLSPTIHRSTQLIGLFLKYIPEYLSELNGYVEKKDAQNTVKLGHKLKGSCLSFGAVKMAPLCKEIEDQGKVEEWEHITGLTQSLSTEFDAVKRVLAQNDI